MVGWECPTNPREVSGLDPEAVHLNFVRYEQGVELEPEPPTYGGPRFDFNA